MKKKFDKPEFPFNIYKCLFENFSSLNAKYCTDVYLRRIYKTTSLVIEHSRNPTRQNLFSAIPSKTSQERIPPQVLSHVIASQSIDICIFFMLQTEIIFSNISLKYENK